MTTDPRTEEIRGYLSGHTGTWGQDRAAARYLLGRVEALEGGRETEQEMLRNGATLVTDMAGYQKRLRTERDRYRAENEAMKAAIWGVIESAMNDGPHDIDPKTLAALSECVEPTVTTAAQFPELGEIDV